MRGKRAKRLTKPLFSLIANPRAQRGAGVSYATAPFDEGLGVSEAALEDVRSWPGYTPTPTRSLDTVAGEAGVSALHYKDEGQRFGVKSFKPLGGGYAVARILARAVTESGHAGVVDSTELLSGRHRETIARVTVACATDGNHGRAIAWAARTFGCRAVVYLASHVSPRREEAIAAFGAKVVRTGGNHDDAVRQAAADARARGWDFVSQMATATDPQIPSDILIGYSALFAEARDQLRDPPTHVFVQCGVGGLAAAAAAYHELAWGSERPVLIVVEAENAAGVYESIAAGQRTSVTGPLDTLMGGLAAGEVSEAAWPLLERGADFCVTIPDQAAVDTMRLLATQNPPIVGGEAGVAGLAAALAVCLDDDARRQLGLDAGSSILTIGTEGATDPELYQQFVGASAER